MEKQIQKIRQWLGTGAINLFGMPFAGKDTQGRTLAGLFDAALIGGGDILRNHDDPKKIEEIMNAGGLIPSDYFFNMVLPYLSQPQFKGKPLILDAVGRAKGEEHVIVEAAEASGHPLKAVVLLQLSEEEAWRRLELAKQVHDRDGRDDDRREVLQNRLKKFRTKTVPVIEFYRKAGLLIEVDGARTREGVTQEIINGLAART